MERMLSVYEGELRSLKKEREKNFRINDGTFSFDFCFLRFGIHQKDERKVIFSERGA